MLLLPTFSFLLLSLPLSLATPSPSPTKPLLYPQISTSLSSLNSKVQTLRTKIQAYAGGVPASIPVAEANLAIDEKINSTLSVLSSHPAANQKFTEKQCDHLLEFFGKKLVVSIEGTLDALVAKKEEFTEAGLREVVRKEMGVHRDGWIGLVKGVGGRCAKEEERRVCGVEREVRGIYSSAYKAYA